MPIINKGTAFSNGEQLTADKINNLLDLATFNQSATDSASTTVNSASQIVVADSGVTTAKLATDAVETAKIKDANVTKAKIEDVADYKVLGNVSGAAAAPQEVSILDEDDMVSDSDTALATQQSIKTYVDANAVFTKSFVSSDQTFPNDNSEVSVAHSLGEVPKIIQVFAKMTASVNGYASGDFVLLNTGDAPGTGNGPSLCTASNVAFYRSGGIRIASRNGSGVPLTLSSSNCSLVLKAFA